MKVRDLRPCDSCGGQIAGRMPDGSTRIQFYVVKATAAILDARAINQHMGLATMFNGSHALAEVFSSQPEVAHVVGDHKESGGWTEALLCLDCYCKPLNLAALAETINDRQASDEEKSEETRS